MTASGFEGRRKNECESTTRFGDGTNEMKTKYFPAVMISFTVAARVVAICTLTATAQADKTIFKFDFGPGRVAPGYTPVRPEMTLMHSD